MGVAHCRPEDGATSQSKRRPNTTVFSYNSISDLDPITLTVEVSVGMVVVFTNSQNYEWTSFYLQ